MFLNILLNSFVAFFVIFSDFFFVDFDKKKPNNQVFYSSSTIVEYNKGKNSLEFSTKLLSKNLETAVGIKIDNPSFDKRIINYLKDHFTVYINGIPSEISYGGKQKSMKTIRIYFEVRDVQESIHTIEIKNTFLFKEFPNQQNFINIEVGENRRSFICKKSNPSGRANFN